MVVRFAEYNIILLLFRFYHTRLYVMDLLTSPSVIDSRSLRDSRTSAFMRSQFIDSFFLFTRNTVRKHYRIKTMFNHMSIFYIRRRLLNALTYMLYDR